MTAVTLAAAPPPRARFGRRGAGAVIVAALIAFGTLGPLLITADPARQDLGNALAPMFGDYWLGTDHYGRSLLARLAHATGLSLALAALTVAGAAVPGVALGLLAAWRGGWTDRAAGALADMVLALPGLLLVLLFAAFAPGEFLPLYLGLALAQWVEYFRVTRATARSVLARSHVEAARLLGFGPPYIARHLLLPELAPVLGTLMAFGMGTAVLAISTLSFISIGLHPPTAEWGSMVTELLPYYAEAPAHVLSPAVMILLTVLGFHLLAGAERP
ncbi:ABC transporter permease [Azospirillum halopraeferens]|uniref:ABC transporter permease n=1 Tax=Azospirillum halopraeferens TaxID=34010 RepID=UPI0004919FE2|nr:ABC transporter permease [Azospirillum halopraeferens]